MKKLMVIATGAVLQAEALFAQAAAGGAAAPAGKTGGGMLGLLIPMLVLFAIWYFLLIMPQQKKEKQRKAMIEAIKSGDKVVTIGGAYGVVERIKDDVVTLKFGGNATIDFAKSAISRVVTNEPPKPDQPK